MIDFIRARPLAIPFRLAFRHASATRAATQSVWVEARSSDGRTGFGEGCPREYVTGESVASAQAFVARHAAAWRRDIAGIDGLRAWAAANRPEIDANPAAWTAVELALLDLFGKAANAPLERLLGLSPLDGRFRYTAVIGDGPPAEFEAQLARYRQAGFRDFKIKLAGERERDLAKVRALRAAGIEAGAVRADANNLWRQAEAAIGALEALGCPFFALEEPLAAADYGGMRRIAAALGCAIVLDESMARAEQLAALPGETQTWIVNVRVSKMGGVTRSLDFVQQARARGLRLVVGAHVGETSVLTRAAIVVARAAGDALVGLEGAFGTHLLERDVVEPPLTFGAGGVLDFGASEIGARPGLGLEIREAA